MSLFTIKREQHPGDRLKKLPSLKNGKKVVFSNRCIERFSWNNDINSFQNDVVFHCIIISFTLKPNFFFEMSKRVLNCFHNQAIPNCDNKFGLVKNTIFQIN